MPTQDDDYLGRVSGHTTTAVHDVEYTPPPHPPCSSINTSRFASRLVRAMSAWSVKARRAPSRHGGDARVYGHPTAAMHNIEYPPLFLLLFLRYVQVGYGVLLAQTPP